jgi:2-oxoglutarate dehydrogenase E2 component (dihydrolipoamide succinyltransferase)|tara:strand:+ start:286 stop:1623 length:1338 start_codon:yes stop_codon:yes gene_type:complete
MSEKIVVPTLGESVTEATVSKWLKTEGESVDSDEPLVELETDKVNVEVPSPLSGVLEKINVKEGQTVEVGTLLGSVNSETTSQTEKPIEKNKKYTPPLKKEDPIINVDQQVTLFEKPQEKKNKKTTSNGVKPLILDKQEEEEPLILKEEFSQPNVEKNQIKKQASPSARKIAEEQRIDLNDVTGSGKRGTILKEDLINLMGSKPLPNKRRDAYGEEERVRMTRLRMTIAKRLKEAQNNAAMLTTFNEVDMSEIMQMRKNHQSEFQKKYGVKLGFMSFFVKSCISALKNYPAVNAEIQNDEIVYKNYYNISFAVGTDRGLVVPVLRNSDQMSFADIEKNIALLGDKARNGKITIEDLQGGTFTITNGGIYGSMLSTPILNPPQSGVLGMHNIIERAVVKDGNIIVRPMMYLALSYDHRIIDGKEAVSFLKNVKDFLEDPKRLFLDL